MGRTIVIEDQHQTPQEAEQKAKAAQTSARSHEDHQAALRSARQQFDKDLREWRAARPEYAALIKAIKRESSPAEIELLAVAAGADGNEVVGLIEGRRRALRAVEPAREFPAAKKLFDELDRKFREVDARYPLAKNQFESDAILDEAATLSAKRQQTQLQLIAAQIAHENVVAARAVGLI